MSYKKKNIKNVMIIDDQPDVRESIAEQVEDAHFIPLIQNEHIGSLDNIIQKIQSNEVDAIIIDHHLKQKNYATFYGVELIKAMYLCIPILLSTSFLNADILKIQEYRQYIPTIVKPNEINPNLIIQGFELCQNEFSGNFSPKRKPWRSLIRVEEISEDEKFVYIVVPSWNINEKISLPTSMFPKEYKQYLEPDLHFFARVNVDAERYEDLYFDSFEPIKKLRDKYARFIHS